PCRVAGAGVEPTAARGPGGRRAPADGWASGGAEPLALGLAGVFLGLRAAAARITRATVSTPAAATGGQYRRGCLPLPFGAGLGGVVPWAGTGPGRRAGRSPLSGRGSPWGRYSVASLGKSSARGLRRRDPGRTGK